MRWGRKMADGLEGRAQEILSEVDEKGLSFKHRVFKT